MFRFKCFLSLIIVCYSLSSIHAADLFEVSGLQYRITSENTVNIVRQTDKQLLEKTFKDSLFVVPAYVENKGKRYDVKVIETGAFAPVTGMKHLVISEGIEEIQRNAFAGCATLVSARIPSTVKTISNERKTGSSIFGYCISLQKITVDKRNPIFDSRDECNAIINTAENSLVCACSSTVIPSTVETINGDAYVGLTIESLNIPNGVKRIHEYAIVHCPNLKEIKFSSTVSYIQSHSVVECGHVRKISVDKDNTVYNSRNNCNAVICTKDKNLVLGCNETIIPDGVTYIRSYAFADCQNLREIRIPEGVEIIGEYAFKACSALKEVELPSSLTTFHGWSHFYHCTSLDSIYIPQNVKKNPQGIFVGCISLDRIVVDERNEKYDSRNNCNAIIESSTNKLLAGCKTSAIPDGITSIEAYAFRESGLKSIHIPASVTKIDSTAFIDNEDCKAITVADANPVYKSDGSNSIIERASHRLFLACSATTILPEVKIIGASAYASVKDLYSIVLPSGIEMIEYAAFFNCVNLNTIFIPASVKKIERFAFLNCSRLSHVMFMGDQPEIAKDAFNGCPSYKRT